MHNMLLKFRLSVVRLLLLFSISWQYVIASGHNILFISVDHITSDILDSNEYNLPNLQDLKTKGVSFTKVWATPNNAASTAMILTGKYPHFNGVGNDATFAENAGLDLAQDITLARILKQNDIETAFFGKWSMSSSKKLREPNIAGFEHFTGTIQADAVDLYNYLEIDNGESYVVDRYILEREVSNSIDWIVKQQEKPWFLWLSPSLPCQINHVPPGVNADGVEDTVGYEKNKFYYYKMLEKLDVELGRLFSSIPESVKNNLCVILVGTSGINNISAEEDLPRPFLEQFVNVPLIVSSYADNIVSNVNRASDELVSIIDLFSTMLDLYNISEGHSSSSKSLMLYLQDKEKKFGKRKYLYTEQFGDSKLGAHSGYAIRNKRYKFVNFNDSEYLYDLVLDPNEQDNILSQDNESDLDEKNIMKIKKRLASYKKKIIQEAILKK